MTRNRVANLRRRRTLVTLQTLPGIAECERQKSPKSSSVDTKAVWFSELSDLEAQRLRVFGLGLKVLLYYSVVF